MRGLRVTLVAVAALAISLDGRILTFAVKTASGVAIAARSIDQLVVRVLPDCGSDWAARSERGRILAPHRVAPEISSRMHTRGVRLGLDD